MRLVVISGRSGSGKSTALHVLEDVGFTCIDNLPAELLPPLISQIKQQSEGQERQIAVGIDVRNSPGTLDQLPKTLDQVKQAGVDCEVIFLDSRSQVLLQRFSETRRRHPLSTHEVGLKEAINMERKLLDPVIDIANRVIDTSAMTLHQLRDLIKKQIVPENQGKMSILFESFGFKRGVPVDVDFVFDVRCLPNPHWKTELRSLTGNDQAVIDFLEQQLDVISMLDDISDFLTRWISRFQANNRSYLTVAVGCTGGQHRSVYLCNKLADHFRKSINNPIQIHHRELD